MHETIKALYNERGKERKLYLAGHSVGGALATVAAFRLASGDDMDIAAMYTMGSPRCRRIFADFIYVSLLGIT